MMPNKFFPATLILISFLGASAGVAQAPGSGPVNIETTDYLVPHISTVPANAGKRVELFVREKVQPDRRGKATVVLMIAGSTYSAVPTFDSQFENYSWIEYLAAAGFDAFAMDLTGYGLSPRPMMEDACNNSTAQQQQLLVPKPLAQTCPPSYPFNLTSLQTDWDEIDKVVDYLRERRNVDKVSLLAWSRGGARAAGYTAHHPEKVERLFLLAPGRYFRLSPNDPPSNVPFSGVPSTVQGSAAFFINWDSQVSCDTQFAPQLRQVLAAAHLDSDPLGSTWGPAGVIRAPIWNSPAGTLYWGWNALVANQVSVPTLVIRGDLDTVVPIGDIQDFLGDLAGVPQKVFVHVACASHYLMWENQHMALLNASVEWLLQGTYQGQFNGSFAVDASGQVHQEQ